MGLFITDLKSNGCSSAKNTPTVQNRTGGNEELFASIRGRSLLLLAHKLPMLMLVGSLSLVSGCSFHSGQWEGAKALWGTAFSRSPESQSIYWWDLYYRGEIYRLFPLEWDGQSVLTDGHRWILVLDRAEFRLLRDLKALEDLRVVVTKEPQFWEIDEDFLEGSPRIRAEIDEGEPLEKHVVTLGPTRGGQLTEHWLLICGRARLQVNAKELEKSCIENGTRNLYSVTKLDQVGSVVRLDVMIGKSSELTLLRSTPISDIRSIEDFLSGDTDNG